MRGGQAVSGGHGARKEFSRGMEGEGGEGKTRVIWWTGSQGRGTT